MNKYKIKAVERLKRKITIENLWIYIIKILKEEQPLKAYEVKKRLVKKYGIKPATVTVYVILYKMLKDNLIETVKVSGETMYKPTEKGVQALEEAKKILREVLMKIS